MSRFKVVKDADDLEKGRYRAHFLTWEVRDSDRGEYVLWSFRVYHNEESQTISGISGAKFGTKTREYAFVTALRGEALQPGEDVDLDGLRGRPCAVEIDIREGKNGYRPRSTVVGVYAPDGTMEPLDPKDLDDDLTFP